MMPKSCYDSDGSAAENFVPCHPNAEFSACCYVGENCIGDRLCKLIQSNNTPEDVVDSSMQAMVMRDTSIGVLAQTALGKRLNAQLFALMVSDHPQNAYLKGR